MNLSSATRGAIVLATSLFLGALPARADDDTPAAPTFAGWEVKSDSAIPRKQITPIEKKLGAKIKALRNTTYQVNGKKVQVNLMVPADTAAADTLQKALTKGKADWAVVRKGDVIYEFVGKNASMADMKKAGATLSGP